MHWALTWRDALCIGLCMKEIFAIWPTTAALADDLGKPYATVASWRGRGSIPARYDLDLIRAASARGKRLTLEQIAKARAAMTQKGAA